MKAILVIDMPQTCKECKLKYLDTGDDAYWGINVERCIWDNCEIEYNEKAYDCPLKPMPSKRETMVHWKSIGGGEIPTHDLTEYDKGWNDCVEFLKGELND